MYCALSLALPFNYSLLYAICQHFEKKSETYKIRLTFILLLYFRIKIRLFLLFCKHFFCLYLINEFQCTCLLYCLFFHLILSFRFFYFNCIRIQMNITIFIHTRTSRNMFTNDNIFFQTYQWVNLTFNCCFCQNLRCLLEGSC